MDGNLDANERLFVEHKKMSAKSILGEIIECGLN